MAGLDNAGDAAPNPRLAARGLSQIPAPFRRYFIRYGLIALERFRAMVSIPRSVG